MTQSQMFKMAHEQARQDHKVFGGCYQLRFANSLRGVWAVKRGYTGSFVR